MMTLRFKPFLGLLTLALIMSCKPGEKKAKIAVALPLTGDIASLGQGLKRAAEMAIEEKGKDLGYLLEMVAFDDRSDPKEAVSVANRIVADRNVIGVIGHFNSGCSIPASRVYAQAGLAMITPASSNPDLTTQQLKDQWTWDRNVFRANTTDNVQGSYAADFVVDDLKLKRVAIVHDKTSYGQGVAEEFRKRYIERGGTVQSFDGIQVGDRDFRSLLTRVKGLKPDGVYFGGMFSESGLLVRQLRDVGYKGHIILPEANYDPAYLRVAGAAANGSFVTFLGSPPDLTPFAREFVARYKARYPKEELKSYDHYGYETASILIQALKAVGPDRKKIIAYLHNNEFNGVLGTTRFDEKGDTMNKTITLFRVADGEFKPYSRKK